MAVCGGPWRSTSPAHRRPRVFPARQWRLSMVPILLAAGLVGVGFGGGVPSAGAMHSGGCANGGSGPALTNKAFPVLWKAAVGSSAATNGIPFHSEFSPAAHKGEDVFNLPTYTPGSARVVAVESGTVDGGPFWQPSGPGWIVNIRAVDGYLYKNMHLFDDPANYGLFIGAQVTKGQTIGLVGATGSAAGTSPHDHFEMWDWAQENLYCPFPMLVENYSTTGQVTHDVFFQRFVDAPARVGGAFPSGVVGVPANNGGTTRVHPWNGIYVQDLNGGLTGPTIVVDSFGPGAGVVYGATRDKFMSLGGTAVLGRTRDNGGGYDEHSWCAFTSGSPTETRVNDFAGSGAQSPAAVMWTAANGARHVWGGSLNQYIASGGPCQLGPPTSDVMFWYSSQFADHYGLWVRHGQTGVSRWVWHNTAGGSGVWCCS